jgi:hypothetical protein
MGKAFSRSLDGVFKRRVPQLLLTTGLLVTLLAACSTGDAEDAEIAATREAAESTNIVADIEATQVVREFFAPTGEPSPDPTVVPSLANLRLTTSLRDQDAPGETIYTFRRGGAPLYADAQVANVGPGQRVVAVWINSSGDVVERTSVGMENARELVWIPLRWDVPSSIPGGTYTVMIQVLGPGINDDGTPVDDDVTELGSLVFRIE